MKKTDLILLIGAYFVIRSKLAGASSSPITTSAPADIQEDKTNGIIQNANELVKPQTLTGTPDTTIKATTGIVAPPLTNTQVNYFTSPQAASTPVFYSQQAGNAMLPSNYTLSKPTSVISPEGVTVTYYPAGY